MSLIRFLLTATLLMVTSALPARAITLLRDPDIEHAMYEIAKPVLDAAGLGSARMNILMIDERTLNAFVLDRNSIFLNSGLMLKMENAAMLQAVLAHEAAHITNGHLARRPVNLRNARTAAGIGSALAVLAGAATGEGRLAAVGAAGAQGSAQRAFFSHTRAEENGADQSGMRYLNAAGIDPQGMIKVMEIFQGQELVSAGRQDPYNRTHPLSRDRLRVAKRLADSSTAPIVHNENTEYWFQRAKAKLGAFKRSPKWTLNRAGESGYDDIKAMRQAIAYHRQSDLKRATAAINQAIALRPNDAYYYELKGQIMMENRRFKEATAAYKMASDLNPRSALILGSYGRALMATQQPKAAVKLLETSLSRDRRDIRVMRDLAQAHAQLGNPGMASLITAERYALAGRLRDAGIHAKRASGLLPNGSAAWRRAQDVLSAAEQAAKRRKK